MLGLRERTDVLEDALGNGNIPSRSMELKGTSFGKLGPEEYTYGILSKNQKTKKTQCSFYPKVQHFKKGGSRIYVNISACQTTPIEKFGIIVSSMDVTQTVAKEAQLIQASKMSTLGEMATGIAHELYQPLSTIQIGTDFLRGIIDEKQQIDQEELALVCEQMAAQAARAVRTVDHLRELGRKSSGVLEHIDINEPIRGVFLLMNEQLKSLGINVVLDLTDKLPRIVGEGNRIEQMFVDLVMNARDAMEEKIKQFPKGVNTLTVRSFKENTQVVVTISDSGFGISSEIREKIFEPFFTTKGVGKGTGLGLSISYGTVKDYNGTIKVESKVGLGTTIKVAFPASD